MPFWWGRRRKFWLGRRRYRKRWPKRKRKIHRRRFTKRRGRRTTRRRRKRRYKVRRKKAKIPIYQWQPDSIRKCKIKGVGTLVLGAHGKQFVCYTDVETKAPPPKAPGGGGFGCKQYSLQYLYEEYKFRNNIWTHTNINLDLVRYLRAAFTFYRHPDIDFIINYDRQPPFYLDKFTYPLCHPQNLLLGKHKIILLSKASKPNGKVKKRVIIKPPKQMITKWFFQEQFTTQPLLSLRAAAASFQYPHIGCCMPNRTVTFSALNPGFYQQGNWSLAQQETQPYSPWPQIPRSLVFWDVPASEIPTETSQRQEFAKKHAYTTNIHSYSDSVSYDKGYFTSKILKAKFVSRDISDTAGIANLPLNLCRYNPAIDTGKGNTIWLHSNLTTSYSKPQHDEDIIITGMPIWMLLFGWLSYVQHVKKPPDFYLSYTVLIESPAIEVASASGTLTPIIPIDTSFINGNPPYNQTITTRDKAHWWPDVYNQTEILNSLVTAGPYVPKLDNIKNSTWELHYYYNFLFKWGGPESTDQPVADPSKQPIYDALDKQQQTVQIRNPAKQKYATIMHPWDVRRGIITNKALKRMYENLSIDSTFEADSIASKRKRVTGPCFTALQEINQEERACLQTLCEENIYQETPQEENLQQLIIQQQQQQQQIKYNILKLISQMKEQQNMLKLHTGLLN
nr:MAG: ORF1 [Torque teno midi virus]UHM26813.1 MAG: ORF1 [Torque teno midi virus]